MAGQQRVSAILQPLVVVASRREQQGEAEGRNAQGEQSSVLARERLSCAGSSHGPTEHAHLKSRPILMPRYQNKECSTVRLRVLRRSISAFSFAPARTT